MSRNSNTFLYPWQKLLLDQINICEQLQQLAAAANDGKDDDDDMYYSIINKWINILLYALQYILFPCWVDINNTYGEKTFMGVDTNKHLCIIKQYKMVPSSSSGMTIY